MPFIKVMIHYFWSTKNRKKIITHDLKTLLLDHIKKNSIQKGIFIESLNCTEDHIHLLISLGVEQTISKTAMLIKGESSFWINKQKIIKQHFEWQDEYTALSVSKSGIIRVKDYIANQEEHHRNQTYIEECEKFLKIHGFDIKYLG